MANNSSHKAHSLTLNQAGIWEATRGGRLSLTAETNRTRGSRSRDRAHSEAEIRTRDYETHGNCAHQLSYRFTLSHIKTASPQPTSKGAYSGLIHGASGTGTSGPRGHPEDILSHAPQQVASDGTCSTESPTIHQCHRVSGKEQKGYIIIQAQVFIQ